MKDKINACIRMLQEILSEIEEREPVFPEEAKALLEAGICLNCKKKIGGEKSQRGCHAKCYHRVWREISAGRISEGMAIESGLLAPHGQAGRKKADGDLLSDLIKSKERDETPAGKNILLQAIESVVKYEKKKTTE